MQGPSSSSAASAVDWRQQSSGGADDSNSDIEAASSEGVEDFVDFTTASLWERFVAALEMHIVNAVGPGAASSVELPALEHEGSLFVFEHYNDSAPADDLLPTGDVSDSARAAAAAFPVRANPLRRWFGLSRFAVLSPADGSFVRPSVAAVVGSSISIALGQTGKTAADFAVFVPVSGGSDLAESMLRLTGNAAYLGWMRTTEGALLSLATDRVGSWLSTRPVQTPASLLRQFVAAALIQDGLRRVRVGCRVTYVVDRPTLPVPQRDPAWEFPDWLVDYSYNPVEALQLHGGRVRHGHPAKDEAHLVAPPAWGASDAVWNLVVRFRRDALPQARRLTSVFANWWEAVAQCVELGWDSVDDLVPPPIPVGSASARSSESDPRDAAIDRVLQAVLSLPVAVDETATDNDEDKEIKGAPAGSLLEVFCTQLLANALTSLSGVAMTWRKFVSLLRLRWEHASEVLPGLPCAPNPSFHRCLLHQKTQLLNYCLARKIAQTRNQPSRSSPSADPHGRKALFREFDDGRKLYVPETQVELLGSEDQVEEMQLVLQQLPDTAQGQQLRAKLQAAQLLSDMEAFKAANSGCSLSDFVQWHSPRDWLAEDDDVAHSRRPSSAGRLSARMTQPGNLWEQLWQEALPTPVSTQRPLFDESTHAEKVLHWLDTISPVELLQQLIAILAAATYRELASRCARCPIQSDLLGERLDALHDLLTQLRHIPRLGAAASPACDDDPSTALIDADSVHTAIIDAVRDIEDELSKLFSVYRLAPSLVVELAKHGRACLNETEFEGVAPIFQHGADPPDAQEFIFSGDESATDEDVIQTRQLRLYVLYSDSETRQAATFASSSF